MKSRLEQQLIDGEGNGAVKNEAKIWQENGW